MRKSSFRRSFFSSTAAIAAASWSLFSTTAGVSAGVACCASGGGSIVFEIRVGVERGKGRDRGRATEEAAADVEAVAGLAGSLSSKRAERKRATSARERDEEMNSLGKFESSLANTNVFVLD